MKETPRRNEIYTVWHARWSEGKMYAGSAKIGMKGAWEVYIWHSTLLSRIGVRAILEGLSEASVGSPFILHMGEQFCPDIIRANMRF